MTVTCQFRASGPKQPPTLTNWVSTQSKLKYLSACTVLPNNIISDELQGKHWYAHALALTTCLVHKSSQNCQHKSSQNYCQSICLLHSCNLCILQCMNCKYGINCCNLPEHTRGLLEGVPCISVARHPGPPLKSNHPTSVPIKRAQAEEPKIYLIP